MPCARMAEATMDRESKDRIAKLDTKDVGSDEGACWW
jgi:hypothetical protein